MLYPGLDLIPISERVFVSYHLLPVYVLEIFVSSVFVFLTVDVFIKLCPYKPFLIMYVLNNGSV